jgi:hypothetical protein
VGLGCDKWCGLCPSCEAVEPNTSRTLCQSHQVLLDHIVPERYHRLGHASHTFAAYMELEDAYETESDGDWASLHGQFVSVNPFVFLAFTKTYKRVYCVDNSLDCYVQGRSC